MRIRLGGLPQFSKVAFVTLVVASRTFVHAGYYGSEFSSVLSTTVALLLSICLVIWTTRVFKWALFFAIFMALSCSVLQLYNLVSIGEAVSIFSLSSLTLLALALLPLSRMPIRQKFDGGVY
jgi:hypothetical protein